jgi:hypothetical protein
VEQASQFTGMNIDLLMAYLNSESYHYIPAVVALATNSYSQHDPYSYFCWLDLIFGLQVTNAEEEEYHEVLP